MVCFRNQPRDNKLKLDSIYWVLIDCLRFTDFADIIRRSEGSFRRRAFFVEKDAVALWFFFGADT
jgi:hypothetical protein